MHDEGPGRLDVLDSLIEAALRLGREAALDLYRYPNVIVSPCPRLSIATQKVSLQPKWGGRRRTALTKAGTMAAVPLNGRKIVFTDSKQGG